MIPRTVYTRAWASSLRFRDFRLFWVSTLFYSLGTGMEHVAVGWLVFEITGSPFMVGVAAAARMAPLFFLGILSGAMADWLERRLFLFFSALGGVVVAAVMATVLLAGDPAIWMVIVLVAAGGCVFAFTLTTRNAYTYDIVGPEHASTPIRIMTLTLAARETTNEEGVGFWTMSSPNTMAMRASGAPRRMPTPS